MKKNSTFWCFLFVLLGGLLVSACGVRTVESAAALGGADVQEETIVDVPAVIPVEAETVLIEPTAVPATELPAPVRMIYPVKNERLEVQVLNLEWPTHANPDGKSFLYPGPGNMFLGLGIRVKNLSGSDIDLKWDQVYLENKYQDKWYPMWAAYQQTNKYIDPLTIEVLEFEVHPDYDADAHVYLGENGYMRVLFRLPKDNLYYYLSFADLPLIEINWRYR